ncbi:hypothetical protein JYU34_002569 [Plutella xylostella]|uniref:OTU domain-containing protein n=1 Tax=Plutella xylostella TaxID=51655 RepID=A0ABQ7R2M4_PLUXY|nr:hypothetical protein JYU34_002569 [Plutella xylostella]
MEEQLENLETRHRKEKKELQAHIQALKKAAKNDKSKKKELTAEIARLESEIDIRHKKELDEFQETQPEAVGEADPEPEAETKIKVSKAQKRREKKSQQEKERAEQIKLQEKENINGPRNMEIQAINAKLKELKFKLYPIPSDGDCLYKAVSHQLETVRNTTLSVDALRTNMATYIRQNKEDFLPFMCNPETFEMLNDEEFDEYCDKISNTKVWGGQLEIRALSNSLKCPIKVIQATGPESIDQGMEFEGTPIVLTYHRHMYSLGEHYNSTEPVVDEDS